MAKQNYTAPEVQQIDVIVERGFVQTNIVMGWENGENIKDEI